MVFIFLLGRVLFSAFFILKGIEHFSLRMIDHADALGVPMAQILIPLLGIIALVGGLSMLLGYKAKWGAWLLILFLLPSAFLMHKFWMSQDAFSAMMHHNCFWKNISLLGAALMITHFGSGPLSIDKNKKR